MQNQTVQNQANSTDKSGLSYRTLKNSTYGFFGYVWAMAFSIFVTPIIVKKLGIEDFGVYVLVNTVISFLSLLDLGLTIATIKFVSEYHAKRDFVRLQSLLESAHTLFWLIGFVGMVVFFLVGTYFLPVFHISSPSIPHIQTIFVLAGLAFFVTAINAFYAIAPQALQRYDVVTKYSSLQLALASFGVLALVLAGYKLKAIFAVNLATLALLTVLYRLKFRQLLPEVKLKFGFLLKDIFRVYRFGLLVALTNLANNALIQLDRLLIPSIVGPSALTFYSLPGSVASKIPGVTSSMAGVAFPLTSSLTGSGESERIKTIYIRAFRNLHVISAAMAIAITLFAHKIMLYWLGADFAEKSTDILVIMAWTYFILGLFNPLTHFLLGMGKVKFLAKFSAILAVLNLLLLLVLVPKFGILGAAWAYLGSVLPVVWVFYKMEKDFLSLGKRTRFYFLLYGKLIITAAIYFVIVRFLFLPLAVNLAALLVLGPASVLLYLALYKLLGFMEQEDWLLLLEFIKRIMRRILPKARNDNLNQPL